MTPKCHSLVVGIFKIFLGTVPKIRVLPGFYERITMKKNIAE
jgi:hypothetical protein